jgi:glutathione S-transferase
MVTVHHLNNSRSQRILWLLEELGVDYEVKRYERDAKTMLAPQALKDVHPLGKSPVITDAGKTIAETGAIVDYLIETYGAGRLIPAPGTPERLSYSYWTHYAEGSAMPPLVMKLIFSAIPKSPALPFFMRPVARALMGGVTKSYLDPQIANHIKFWAATLDSSPYFAGDELTGADIMMSFPVEAAAVRAGLPQVLTLYLAGLQARPAYKRALERGGPYALLGG